MYNLVFLTFVFFTVNGLHVFFEMGGRSFSLKLFENLKL